ncbi:Wnt-5b, partial [Paramuricea clavata]
LKLLLRCFKSSFPSTKYSDTMKSMCQFVIVVFVLYFCEQIDSASVEMKRSIVQDGQNAAMFVVQPNLFCAIYRDLSPKQHHICRNNLLLMGSVIEGARLARKECIKQFRNERWNCSNISGKSTALGLMTKYATKEAAFNYALVTAGIVQVMARNCMKGDLPSCHCSRAKRPAQSLSSLSAKYKWGGCGDNIQYASDFSKKFLDDPKVLEKLNGSTNAKRAEKLLMDHHNKEAGRQAVFKNKKVICKCHGATSHCSVKTCWYQVQEFNVIGDYLKAKYRSAVKATLLKRKDGKVTLK